MPLPTWLRWGAWGMVLTGVLERAYIVVTNHEAWLYACDGYVYWHLAGSIASGQGVAITNPSVGDGCNFALPVGPSHHFAPLWAFIQAVFILLFGATTATWAAATVALSVAAVFVVYWTTRDLFGGDAAVLVAGIVAHEWSLLLFGTMLGYAENLVLITFALTFWAILRGLTDERMLLLAGLFAGLGYLGRASVGWFFVVAGLGGLLWRVHFHGWRILKNPWYLGAMAIFGTFLAAWGTRNLIHFWDGDWSHIIAAAQTSEFHDYALSTALHQPRLYSMALFAKLILLGTGLLLPLAPVIPAIAARAKAWREEAVSGLLLGAALIFAFALIFSAAFGVVEGRQLFWGHHLRYVTPALVPLLWIVWSHPGPQVRGWEWSLTFLIVILGMR
ncbi:MAG TPA: glycosyltransferase family 39 protein, partial [Candidatus Thermoplasmatota archaeon]|nr:glycosyltransferase family 39 protein [Candidatus Thermoplasmatota archaeon]